MSDFVNTPCIQSVTSLTMKIRPYFEKKILSEITVADVRAWQNELLMYKDKNGKAPYIWPASFCNTSRQSCSHGFQRLSPVPLDGAAGHSHHRADLAVRQFQDTMQYQDALSRLGQASKGSGHQPVADLKLTAIGRKYKTVAGVLIYRA